MLYFVATPIGNLEDISARALRVLRGAAAIGAEDTRHTRTLLSHFDIHVPLFSFHQHNERARIAELIPRLRAGAEIAIVADAGMPLIADAGQTLAARLRAEDLPYTCIPGASAVETALVLSGLRATPYQFVGFAPRRGREREEFLAALVATPLTSVVFESPQRLVALLEDMARVVPLRPAAVARELTKLHEEVRTGTAGELHAHYAAAGVRGECVVVIGAADSAVSRGGAALEIGAVPAAVRAVARIGGVPHATAAKIVAALTGLPRKQVYTESLEHD